MFDNYILKITTNKAETSFSFSKETFHRKNKSEEDASKKNTSLSNVARVRNRIFEITINNNFTHFITITLDEKKIDRYDAALISKKLRKVFNNYKSKVDNNFAYLLVPEYHKDKAIHFHGLFRLSSNNKDLRSLGTDKKTGHKVFRSKWLFNSFGSNRLVSFPPSHSVFVSKYITKYITKDLTARPLGRSFYSSLNLKKNEVHTARNLSRDDLHLFLKVFAHDKTILRANGFTAYFQKDNVLQVNRLINVYSTINHIFKNYYHIKSYYNGYNALDYEKIFIRDKIDWEEVKK